MLCVVCMTGRPQKTDHAPFEHAQARTTRRAPCLKTSLTAAARVVVVLVVVAVVAVSAVVGRVSAWTPATTRWSTAQSMRTRTSLSPCPPRAPTSRPWVGCFRSPPPPSSPSPGRSGHGRAAKASRSLSLCQALTQVRGHDGCLSFCGVVPPLAVFTSPPPALFLLLA
jgi:hypothetical protein